MDRPAEYSYRPIRTDQIRLCRFVTDRNFLSAVLEPFPANGPHPPYTALSYTWADDRLGSDKDWPLIIGDGPAFLPALGSLRPFIQALRKKKTLLDGTWWWIDSICIDQKNMEERSRQVRHMRDIFANAEKVTVWLGPESDDSECALDFIYFLNEENLARLDNADLRSELSRPRFEKKWTALRNFFLRRWWSRIWTIQESVIPSNLSFWCGSRQLSRDAVSAALSMADRCNAPEFRGSIAFHHAFNRRRAWQSYESVRRTNKQLNLSLVALAAYFCSNEATDDRDRIYGLSALSTETHGLEVNYSWTVEEVYLRFAQAFIKKHKSLDIISFASLFSTGAGSTLRSWVPDWRARVEPLVVPLMASQSSTDFVGNLRPPRLLSDSTQPLRYSASGTLSPVCTFQGPVLIAHGYVIDVIDGIAGTQMTEVAPGSNQHTHDSDAAHSSSTILESICRSLVLDRRDRYLCKPMPTEQYYQEFVHICLSLITGNLLLIKKEFWIWFDSTRMMCFHGKTLQDHLRSIQKDYSFAFLDSAPDQDEYIQDSFYGRFFDTVQRMSLRLMTSRNGRIGMVPDKAVTGDMICLLFGCSVPIVLRKSEYKDQFTVVGECFLDGCMEGQALEQRGNVDTTFHII